MGGVNDYPSTILGYFWNWWTSFSLIDSNLSLHDDWGENNKPRSAISAIWACSILIICVNTVSYKGTKQKLTQIYCVSGGSTLGNPLFWKKLTQNINTCCPLKLRNIWKIPLNISLFVLFLSIEQYYVNRYPFYGLFRLRYSFFAR